MLRESCANKYLRTGFYFSTALSIMHLPLLLSIFGRCIPTSLGAFFYYISCLLGALLGTAVIIYCNYKYIRIMETGNLKKYNIPLLLSVSIFLFIIFPLILEKFLGEAGWILFIAVYFLFLPWIIFMIYSATAHFIQCVDMNRGSKLPQYY
jgi:fatty-acid desaturase